VRAEVDYYIKYFLSDASSPVTFPGVLHVAVIGDLTPVRPAARGILKSTTPEEQRCGLILAIARDIESGKSDAELQRWRQSILGTVMTFTTYKGDDELFWAATNHREAAGAMYEVVYYSAVRHLSCASGGCRAAALLRLLHC
jgi:hypothetical protein